MSIEVINIGSIANDGTGDDIRAAFTKVNTNFANIAARAVSATDFGATGDGSTDDTAAIQALVDHCGLNGCIAFFPKPSVRYLLSDEIRINYDGTVIQGAGKFETLFHQSAEGNGNVARAGFFGYQVNNCIIRDIGFTRPSSTQPNLSGRPTDDPWRARPADERATMIVFMDGSNNTVHDIYGYRQINLVSLWGPEIKVASGQAFTTTTTTFKLAATESATDDDPEIVGGYLRFADESGDPFTRITAYNGTTKVATFTPALGSAPTATGTYFLYRNKLDKGNSVYNIHVEETDFAVTLQRQQGCSIANVYDLNRTITQDKDPHAVYASGIRGLNGRDLSIRNVVSVGGETGSPVSVGYHDNLVVNGIVSDGEKYVYEQDRCTGFAVSNIVGRRIGGAATDGRVAGIRLLGSKDGVVSNFSLSMSADYAPTSPAASDRPIGVWVQNDFADTALASLDDIEKTRDVMITDGVIRLADPGTAVISQGVQINCEKNVTVRGVKVISENSNGGAAFIILEGDKVRIENPEIEVAGSGVVSHWLRALTTAVTNAGVFWDAAEFPAADTAEVQDTTTGGLTVRARGEVVLVPIASADAVNNQVFVDSADGVLKFKNGSGTVNSLY